uniref:Uncharacterized protein n=1 Tax=Anopheles dirus TaxID=7168 RepID=A0A182NXE1_9DIPT
MKRTLLLFCVVLIASLCVSEAQVSETPPPVSNDTSARLVNAVSLGNMTRQRAVTTTRYPPHIQADEHSDGK